MQGETHIKYCGKGLIRGFALDRPPDINLSKNWFCRRESHYLIPLLKLQRCIAFLGCSRGQW